jgi:hypothetical protein
MAVATRIWRILTFSAFLSPRPFGPALTKALLWGYHGQSRLAWLSTCCSLDESEIGLVQPFSEKAGACGATSRGSQRIRVHGSGLPAGRTARTTKCATCRRGRENRHHRTIGSRGAKNRAGGERYGSRTINICPRLVSPSGRYEAGGDARLAEMPTAIPACPRTLILGYAQLGL